MKEYGRAVVVVLVSVVLAFVLLGLVHRSALAQSPYTSPYQGQFSEMFPGGYSQNQWYRCGGIKTDWTQWNASDDFENFHCETLPFQVVSGPSGYTLLSDPISLAASAVGEFEGEGGPEYMMAVMGILPPVSEQEFHLQCSGENEGSATGSAGSVVVRRHSHVERTGNAMQWLAGSPFTGIAQYRVPRWDWRFDTYADDLGALSAYSAPTASQIRAAMPVVAEVKMIANAGWADGSLDCVVTASIPWGDLEFEHPWIPPEVPDGAWVPDPWSPVAWSAPTPWVPVADQSIMTQTLVLTPESSGCYVLLPEFSVPEKTVFGWTLGGSVLPKLEVCTEEYSVGLHVMGFDFGGLALAFVLLGIGGAMYRLFRTG